MLRQCLCVCIAVLFPIQGFSDNPVMDFLGDDREVDESEESSIDFDNVIIQDQSENPVPGTWRELSTASTVENSDWGHRTAFNPLSKNYKGASKVEQVFFKDPFRLFVLEIPSESCSLQHVRFYLYIDDPLTPKTSYDSAGMFDFTKDKRTFSGFVIRNKTRVFVDAEDNPGSSFYFMHFYPNDYNGDAFVEALKTGSTLSFHSGDLREPGEGVDYHTIPLNGSHRAVDKALASCGN